MRARYSSHLTFTYLFYIVFLYIKVLYYLSLLRRVSYYLMWNSFTYVYTVFLSIQKGEAKIGLWGEGLYHLNFKQYFLSRKAWFNTLVPTCVNSNSFIFPNHLSYLSPNLSVALGGALALELLTQKPSYNNVQNYKILQGIGEGYYILPP